MIEITASFQLEVRYKNILNFSNSYRDLLGPFVKIADSIKITQANTVEEKIHFQFEDAGYQIIAGWDRLVLHGQGDLSLFTHKNSPMEMPFMAILNKLSTQEGFGQINNVLFLAIFAKESKESKEEIVKNFQNKWFKNDVSDITSTPTDIAISIVEKNINKEITVSTGPYLGIWDITRREIQPFNVEKLGNLDFLGYVAKIKYFEMVSKFDLNSFKKIVTFVDNKKKVVWQKVQV